MNAINHCLTHVTCEEYFVQNSMSRYYYKVRDNDNYQKRSLPPRIIDIPLVRTMQYECTFYSASRLTYPLFQPSFLNTPVPIIQPQPASPFPKPTTLVFIKTAHQAPKRKGGRLVWGNPQMWTQNIDNLQFCPGGICEVQSF